MNIYELILNYFSGNADKTELWFKTKNPLLGGMTPRDMILVGRHKKLELFIKNALEENNP